MLEIALHADAAWGDEAAWNELASRSVRAAILLTPHAELLTHAASAELSISLADDAQVQALNSQWRGKNEPTNVLSFPMVQPDLIAVVMGADEGEMLLGDLILAYETCAREATVKGISLADHACHLIVHGALHLLGYDHASEADAEAMEAMETRALATMGLADPYGDRAIDLASPRH